MARAPILGAGGIVVRSGDQPLIAIVQRRKDGEWVLPKGKLKREESAVVAAEREVTEETGQEVVVHEFLGAISYRAGRRPKVVQFWRMQAFDQPGRKPTRDIKAVKWLPLESAIRKLTDPLEQIFLQNIAERSCAIAAPLADQSALAVANQPLQAEQNAPVPPAQPEAPLKPLAELPPTLVKSSGRPAPLATTAQPPALKARPAPPPPTINPAKAVSERGTAVPPMPQPLARRNLLDRILLRWRRNRLDLLQPLHWMKGKARCSGQ